MTTSKSVSRGIGIFLIAYQIFFLAALPFYLYFGELHLSVFVIAFILYFTSGISITAGYHRLYSHKTYKAHPIYEAFMIFFGTLATQGSIIRWSYDHRRHHAYVDTDADPYSISKGFWYAHFLWLLEEPKAIEKRVVPDLYENKWLVWQHENYLALVIGLNALAGLFFTWALNDFWGAFLIIVWGRMFALHHSTWFINSLAHTWGDQPFSQEQSAVNNYVIALLTFGEGYHNFHHVFANDYRNGIRWYHFDPSKWLIWIGSKLGLTSALKQVDDSVIKKRLVIEHKRLLQEKLKQSPWFNTGDLAAQVEEAATTLLKKLNEWGELRVQLMKKDIEDSQMLQSLQLEFTRLSDSLKDDLRHWQMLSEHILSLRPALN